MLTRARVRLLRHARRGLLPGRCLVSLPLLAFLAFEFLPCTGPGALGPTGDCASPGLSRLRVCGGIDAAPGSLAEPSILRSELFPPLPPTPGRGAPDPRLAALPEGFRRPVDRPPRAGA